MVKFFMLGTDVPSRALSPRTMGSGIKNLILSFIGILAPKLERFFDIPAYVLHAPGSWGICVPLVREFLGGPRNPGGLGPRSFAAGGASDARSAHPLVWRPPNRALTAFGKHRFLVLRHFS